MTKILLIEPDEYYHAMFSDLLDDSWELLLAASAAEARGILRGHLPDAVVLELVLPDRSGYELLRDIRAPVIIYTRAGRPEDVKAALNLGASGFLVKGVNSPGEVKQLLLTLNP